MCVRSSGHHILLRGARRKRDVLHGKRGHKEHRGLPAALVARDGGPGPELGERTRSCPSSHGGQEGRVPCLMFQACLFTREKCLDVSFLGDKNDF